MNKGNLQTVIDILGEENADKLRKNIVEIILEQIRTDLEGNYEYIISPDDITVFCEDCKEEAFAKIRNDLVSKFEKDMRGSIGV